MSEESGKAGAVLLPPAKVALHVKDAEIREAARILSKDWRFTRVTFEIHDGSLETAIDTYGGVASPELVIVETSTIEDGFTDRLEILAGKCSANTSAVVIGPVNDVYLYRKLIDMGVSDYLVRPVTSEVLAQVIAKTLIEKFGVPDSRLIAFVGSKGGVGTSTLAQNFASIGAELDEKTIIIDAAGGWSYLAVAMGTEPVTNFGEITRLASSIDEAAFKRMIYSVSEKLSVLATGSDAMLDDFATSEALDLIVNKLMVTYPAVIVDLSSASSNVKKNIISRAHETIVVATPSLPSLRGARTLLSEIKNLRGGSMKNIHFVINKAGESASHEVSKSDIEKVIEVKPLLVIPYDEKVFFGVESQGKKISEFKGGETISASFSEFAKAVLHSKGNVAAVKTEDGSLLNGLLSKFKGKKN